MLTAILLVLGVTIAPPDSLSARDITASYAAVFQLHRVPTPRGDTLLAVSVVPPAPSHLLARFIRDNERWLFYLLQHGRSFELEAVASGAGDSATLHARFAARLVADSAFNGIVLPAAAAYLRRDGHRVLGVRSPLEKQVIPMEHAMRIAVRFFYPDIITPEQILTHVCTVINAVKELGPARNLAFEALAFSAIMRQVRRGDSSLLESDFGPARDLMNRLDSRGTPDAVRLNRAQGVMWGLMSQSRRLREVISLEYASKADYLPFILVPGA